MTPEEYEKVGELFFQACELEADARPGFLQEACEENAVLREAVEDLLRSDRDLKVADDARRTKPQGQCSNHDPVVETETAPSGPTLAELYPEQIGHFKILESIGEGGMGIVYLAEQREPVRRRVAVKVIKLGMDTREVVARFEAERQAMALMDHPAIASVYEADSTETGRPYFVMEFVQGLPITSYCDRHKLDLTQRLRLFRQVCQGVHHAHLKGIIHRDIKPSNILVATSDGEPRVKIIDFGVARATNQRLTEKTLYTEVGRTVGTPQYMSPEQAEMSTENIDHRSDIYSLGVLLYELLVGELPLDWESLRKVAFDEVLRRIREEEPPLPSVRWSRLNRERTKHLASLRGVDPWVVHQALRGDLDWVVMKALDKERDRRYGTASELADDIERQLNDQPVLAGPPSGWYVIRKTIRRHRARVAVGLVILLLLVGGLVGIGLALVESRREQAKAGAARYLLSTLFSAAVEKDISMLEFLDRAAARVEDDLAEFPEVRAGVEHDLGAAYLELGEFEKAKEQFHSAAAHRREALGSDHLDTLESEFALADVVADEDNNAEAARLMQQILARATRRWGEDHPFVIRKGVVLALTLLDSDEGGDASVEANRLIDRALVAPPSILDADTRYWALLTLSEALLQQGDLDAAETRALEARDSYVAEYPEEDASLASIYVQIGSVQLEKGDLEGAAVALEKAVELRKKFLDPGHLAHVHPSLLLAKVYTRQKRCHEAEELVRAMLDLVRDGFEIEDSQVGDVMDDLLHVLEACGDYERARQECREHLEALRRKVGERHSAFQHFQKRLEKLGDE